MHGRGRGARWPAYFFKFCSPKKKKQQNNFFFLVVFLFCMVFVFFSLRLLRNARRSRPAADFDASRSVFDCLRRRAKSRRALKDPRFENVANFIRRGFSPVYINFATFGRRVFAFVVFPPQLRSSVLFGAVNMRPFFFFFFFFF